MSFTWICQFLPDIHTLLEVQLQEAKGLDTFHLTSKAWMVRTNSLFPHMHMHVGMHTLTPSF